MTSSKSGAGSPLDLRGPTPHPVSLPQFESLDVAARYHSARCGGDFFDALAIDARLVFLLTDIAGEPPETRAIAVDVQRVFRARTQELFEHPDANESEAIATLARDLNCALIEVAHGVRLAPAFLGCYNLTLHILTYHFAGQLLAVFHDTEKARVLEPEGIPLGLFTHSTYEPAVLGFDRNAKLLLVTKGMTEGREGPTLLDDERIALLLNDSTINSASKTCEAVLRAADGSGKLRKSRVSNRLHPRNQKRRDDLTAVALVRRGETVRS
jgi:serine phosphatase RsbU (regulator of sigma subunit)